MAESKRISDLIAVEDISMNDLLLLSSFIDQDNYESRKAGLGLVALAMLSDFTFDDVLATASKNIIGAINELNQGTSNTIELAQTEGKYETKGAWTRVGKLVTVSALLEVKEQYSTRYATIVSNIPKCSQSVPFVFYDLNRAVQFQMQNSSATQKGIIQLYSTSMNVGKYMLNFSYTADDTAT